MAEESRMFAPGAVRMIGERYPQWVRFDPKRHESKVASCYEVRESEFQKWLAEETQDGWQVAAVGEERLAYETGLGEPLHSATIVFGRLLTGE